MKIKYYCLSFLIVFVCLTQTSCGKESTGELKPFNAHSVILAFGDSLTYGTGASKESSYPSQLEKRLNIKVVNAGVPGETTGQALQRLPNLLEHYQPQLIIIGLGGNDLLRKHPQASIKKNLVSMVHMAKKAHADVIIIAPPKPAIFLKAPPLYEEIAQQENILVETQLLSDLLGDRQYKSDRIHLNAKGYKALSDGIYQLIMDHQTNS